MIDIIVPAAGSGKRIGMSKNKMFLELEGIPILYRTLKQLSLVPEIKRIMVVLKESEISLFEKMIDRFGAIEKIADLVIGGKERANSVRNGLQYLSDNQPAEIIMVHDGARPFFSPELIQDLAKETMLKGAAIPVLPIVETVREKKPEQSATIVPREYLFTTQTPQSFHRKFLAPCFLDTSKKTPPLTDDAAYIEYFGKAVSMIKGEKWNIKITTKEDLEWSEFLLRFYPRLNILSNQ